ncbi:hypothetical protein BCR33DRAFT_745074 [Rhizoclosmatium globosum]|uniref:Uncharacterized protein n=1 Tax=Rhizoclosmatium globosum TaxID=329046 RepID=A0A1Y2B4X1_9FUNG|nr:hypothetical protein BCR33DRAFT_745074 [Rhizoclosmatium globosum]|eukprot:ORY29873.1 hypothetical protein BCR33DRAFT_745074 [Rhizoclosmatium globosum]
MYATNAALLGVNEPTDMYIDNMAVIQTFKSLERSKFNIKRRELFTLSNVYTAAQMCHIAKSITRPLPILHHVKSHTGVPGNELADSDANDGHMAPLLKMKLEGQSLIQFTLCTNNIMLEGNYRETLTMINNKHHTSPVKLTVTIENGTSTPCTGCYQYNLRCVGDTKMHTPMEHAMYATRRKKQMTIFGAV